jgi:hypothetical protein
MKKEYDLKILEANYKIQLDPLEKAVKKFEKPEPEPKKKTTRGRTERQKLREEAHKHYESEIKRIEKRKVSAETKAELKKNAKNDLEEELQRIENMP